jgi:cell division protein ZapA (FtsZ GTPase activity inhibitor)
VVGGSSPLEPTIYFKMSNKIAVGSKIYDISNFSELEREDIAKLSKSLNYRVNQVISVFKIYDQEMALVMSALSLLEENKSLHEKIQFLTHSEEGQDNLFPENINNSSEELYTKEEVEEIILNVINSLTVKLKQSIDEK